MDVTQEAVLVTGGASGIGLAVARGLLGAGRRVLVADVSQERLDEVRGMAPPDRLGCARLDVADEAQVMDTLARLEADFGPISGLVNSAGIGRDVPFLDTDAALLRRILEVNLVGSFVVAREAARRMRERGRGSIVNIASVSGIRGNAGRAAYGASKGGVVTLTRVMAVELAAYGIRVNAVAGADRDAAGGADAYGRGAGGLAPGGAAASLRGAGRAERHDRLAAGRVAVQLRDGAGDLRGWRVHCGGDAACGALSPLMSMS